MCGWSNAPPTPNKTQVLWLRNSGVTTSIYSSPQVDHTTGTADGWYAFVPIDVQSDGVALLQSEVLGPFIAPVCFGFWYHILDDYRESLNKALELRVVYSDILSNNTLIELMNITTTTQTEWQPFNMTLNKLPRGRFQLMTFEGQAARADVAIDDIFVRNGRCDGMTSTTQTKPMTSTPEPESEKQWDCDFESSCLWSATGPWRKTYWIFSKFALIILILFVTIHELAHRPQGDHDSFLLGGVRWTIFYDS